MIPGQPPFSPFLVCFPIPHPPLHLRYSARVEDGGRWHFNRRDPTRRVHPDQALGGAEEAQQGDTDRLPGFAAAATHAGADGTRLAEGARAVFSEQQRDEDHILAPYDELPQAPGGLSRTGGISAVRIQYGNSESCCSPSRTEDLPAQAEADLSHQRARDAGVEGVVDERYLLHRRRNRAPPPHACPC